MTRELTNCTFSLFANFDSSFLCIQLLRAICTVFFAHVHPAVAIIHKPTFTSALAHNLIPPHLLHAVCALAAPHSKQPLLQSPVRRFAGKRYAETARSLMFDDDSRLRVETTLQTAQAVCLLFIHELCSKNENDSERWQQVQFLRGEPPPNSMFSHPLSAALVLHLNVPVISHSDFNHTQNLHSTYYNSCMFTPRSTPFSRPCHPRRISPRPLSANVSGASSGLYIFTTVPGGSGTTGRGVGCAAIISVRQYFPLAKVIRMRAPVTRTTRPRHRPTNLSTGPHLPTIIATPTPHWVVVNHFHPAAVDPF